MSRLINTRSELHNANNLKKLVADNSLKLICISLNDSQIAFLGLNENRLISIDVFDRDSDDGNVILAKISNIKKDINAAFVNISSEQIAFLKLDNIPDRYKPIKQGDLIPVKLLSKAQKGKRTSVTAKISPKKLPDNWIYKSAYAVLCENDSLEDFFMRNYKEGSINSIITESIELYNMLNSSNSPILKDIEIKLYNDETLSLSSLYSLKTKVLESYKEKVFLNNGGYLVINRTEALTVIDVNSGKYTPSKKEDKEDSILKLNIDAAKEVALQLKLRNISGMILIDFINMEKEESKSFLIEKMEEYLSEDACKSFVIDITPLGIMELTRQKKNKPLYELTEVIEYFK